MDSPPGRHAPSWTLANHPVLGRPVFALSFIIIELRGIVNTFICGWHDADRNLFGVPVRAFLYALYLAAIRGKLFALCLRRLAVVVQVDADSLCFAAVDDFYARRRDAQGDALGKHH